MPSADSSQSSARYRCSECGRTEGLTAISYGYMIGNLSRDGQSLDDYSLACEDTEVCEDTIECPDHISAAIEEVIDGVWCRWEACAAEGCRGGKIKRWGTDYDCHSCDGRGGRDVQVEALAR